MVGGAIERQLQKKLMKDQGASSLQQLPCKIVLHTDNECFVIILFAPVSVSGGLS